ncbi:alpha/beta hydrolase [Pseudonocardia eucalypti]|uniref:Alpha/beta hydrolase n=1 Tax=Pseudonocardia eucalypti TaxID=648755 RepID=A0ABP9QGQ2_9PSEU|nr:acetyl esterase [Pseudonocardia eucalypti]
MTLDPQAKGLLDQLREQGVPDFADMGVDQARGFMAAFLDLEGPSRPVAEVRDLDIPGPDGNRIPARVYRPSAEPRPVLMYFHGGGWVLGGLEVADKPCRQLALATDCAVVSVDYRLAPEHKAPAAAEDCYAATAWAAEHPTEVGGNGRLGVAGDSAGGNLAAVVSLMARDRGGPALSVQVPIYPITDVRCGHPSRTENGEGYLLTKRSMEWFEEQYLATGWDADNPYVAPLRAKDLSGLPAAAVITAGYCPLRDEGQAYAARLCEAGVPVLHLPNPSMIHGFMWMSGVIDHAAGVYQRLGGYVKEAMRGESDR